MSLSDEDVSIALKYSPEFGLCKDTEREAVTWSIP
jgi:hypothetical protein